MAPAAGPWPQDRSEEKAAAWSIAFERLRARFPEAGSDRISQALQDAGGHAGRAAVALRARSEHRWDRDASETERLRTELTAERERRRSFTGESHASGAAGQEKAPQGETSSGASCRPRTAELQAAEGKRLRQELDGVLKEARLERQHYHSGSLLGGSAADEEAAAAAAERLDNARCQLLQVQAATSAMTSARLCHALEACRDEGRRLRVALEEDVRAGRRAVDAGEAARALNVEPEQRERLCRELELMLAQTAAAAAAALRGDRTLYPEAKDPMDQGRPRARAPQPPGSPGRARVGSAPSVLRPHSVPEWNADPACAKTTFESAGGRGAGFFRYFGDASAAEATRRPFSEPCPFGQDVFSDESRQSFEEPATEAPKMDRDWLRDQLAQLRATLAAGHAAADAVGAGVPPDADKYASFQRHTQRSGHCDFAPGSRGDASSEDCDFGT